MSTSNTTRSGLMPASATSHPKTNISAAATPSAKPAAKDSKTHTERESSTTDSNTRTARRTGHDWFHSTGHLRGKLRHRSLERSEGGHLEGDLILGAYNGSSATVKRTRFPSLLICGFVT